MEYKELVYDEEAILNLYLDNKWYAYTENPEKLFKGILNSRDVIAVYDDELLVALV